MRKLHLKDSSKTVKIRNAYKFLAQAELENQIFNLTDLVQASGWTLNTAKAMRTKKLAPFLYKEGNGSKVVGVRALGEEAFCRLCSQTAAIAIEPQRPRLEPKVEFCVNKARDSVLAAVQHYNNPTATFRSGNFIVLMIIGYTALFHAIFERKGVDYIAYNKDGTPKKLAGDNMLWDVSKCADYYNQNYENGQDVAMVKNIEFMLPIRHKIEHRPVPSIDTDISGHCQSMLFNFERILCKEFTDYYSLNNCLTLALQFSTARSPETVTSLRRLQSAEYNELKQYIANFHANLPDSVISDPNFAFRVWLFPKPANEARRSDYSVEYVPLDQAQAEKVMNLVVAIKTKNQVVDPSKECNLWEQEVVDKLKARLGSSVTFGDSQKILNGVMIRWIVKSHKLESPSEMYYRPDKDGSRAMYGPKIIDWIAEQYTKDPNFFYNAKIAAMSKP